MIIFQANEMYFFTPLLRRKNIQSEKEQFFFLDNPRNRLFSFAGVIISTALIIVTILSLFLSFAKNKTWEVILVAFMFFILYSAKSILLGKDQLAIRGPVAQKNYRFTFNIHLAEWFLTYISLSLFFIYISTMIVSMPLMIVCELASICLLIFSLLPFVFSSIFLIEHGNS